MDHNRTVSFFVEPNLEFESKIRYTIQLFGKNKKLKPVFVNDRSIANVVISTDNTAQLPICRTFYQSINALNLNSHTVLNEKGVVACSSGQADYLATAFYLVNSLQEYYLQKKDNIGRTPFKSTIQFKLSKPIENTVQHCFNKIYAFLFPSSSIPETKSRIFLTHDIDTVYGSLLQDGFHCLKKVNLQGLLKIIWNTLMAKPGWLNMDKIMKLESEYDVKSTFFWLVNKGKTEFGLHNGDYNIHSKAIRNIQNKITIKGFSHGLHKSISDNTFSTELQKLGIPVIANRNHYLKMQLPDHYNNIEASGLKLDTTLGFAEQHGFRNSYGLPFVPYNIKEDKPYSFVEAPLHIMDGTFQKYYGWPVAKTKTAIGDFIEKHQNNCVLTLLWHNTFFSNYKFEGYLQVYRSILEQICELGVKSITPSEIVNQYSFND